MKTLLALIFLIPVIAAIAPLLHSDSDLRVPGEYIIVLHRNATKEIRDYHIQALENKFEARGKGERTFGAFHIADFIGFSGSFGEDILQAVRELPVVNYVEVNQYVYALDEAPLDEPTTVPVTDAGLWGIDRIDQRNLPLSGTYTYWDSAGFDVVSYIIDTGILLTHQEFTPSRAVFGTNTVTGETNEDCHGHGTHVAGTVGGNNYGVARRTTLVAVKVLNCAGSGTWAGVAAGVDWAARDRQTRAKRGVSNMSLGGSGSTVADDAVVAAIATGLNFGIAAGNSAADACSYSPARVAGALTVGATTNTDARASFSNYGTCVDVYAPGQNVLSAWIGSNTATSIISGTSMASPHVAGAVAVHLGHITADESVQVTHDYINRVATSGIIPDPIVNPSRFLYSPYQDI